MCYVVVVLMDNFVAGADIVGRFVDWYDYGQMEVVVVVTSVAWQH